jgi:hypothetical protein
LVIAQVVTADGFPLAYEVMDGNTSDRSTLRLFLQQIEDTYGKAQRVWVLDRDPERMKNAFQVAWFRSESDESPGWGSGYPQPANP